MITFEQIIIILFDLSFIYIAIAAIPQIIKLVKAKNSKELSLATFLGFNIIQIASALHAYSNHETAFLIGTLILMCAYIPITILIIHYRT